ncbi:tryptophan halogenase family protein [Dyella sp. A6]|uniref:tryptophan halogenase family protein n=1 Tax=Dyella aluminiiresistens TaxID=3069105 RepID=UPI002E7947D8|nr:tryptophan halogenase family protein [Dyella sp. A6]
MADVATVFNQNIVPYSPGPRTDAAPPVKRIVVVGGGTAGWMTALLLANSDYGPRLEVTVLESPQVGTVGVGEGSTPWLRGFFDSLGIEESEWMPACHATYKNGIRFDHWCTRPGHESYFHPFASMLDNMTMTQFVDNVHRRLEGEDVEAHPDRFFIATRLARMGLGPRPRHDFPFDVWYAYHFDSNLLGAFLHKKAVERGVRHISRHMHDVTLDAQGDIAALKLDGDETLAADFFVDCTGFASLLIGKALQTPYVSYADNLFNDAAVALPSPSDGHAAQPLMSQTVSTALRHGWAWKIPLTHRYGNGYVYSTASCSADQAEAELRAHLGLLDDPTPARHLRMRVGRVTRHWNRNCVAVGLSQGFIEPLEATALLFVQRTASLLVKALESGDLGERTRTAFNEAINERFEGTRDYIVTHYKTNTRTDTEYWRANAANVNLSQPLQRLLRTWLSSRPIVGGLQQGTYGRGYPTMSWYCLLAGMGLFPEAQAMHSTPPGKLRHDLAAIDNLLERSAANFPEHRALLADIPARPRETSLQLYLW